jgi:hypothetical protein
VFQQRLRDRGRDVARRGVGGQHVLEPELTQALLGRVVARRNEADHGDPGRRKSGQRVAVETPQLGREQDGPRGACGGCGQQVGQVDAAPDHGDPGRRALEAGDQGGFPARAGHRGEDGDAHEPAVVVGRSSPVGTCTT